MKKNCTDTDPLMFENITSSTKRYKMTIETARSKLLIKGDELSPPSWLSDMLSLN